MSFIPKPHEIYKHFKGNLYQIVAIAEHSETGEHLVIYQALYGEFKTYARPLAMFTGRVDKVKYPDVTQEFRFELQGPDSARQAAESEPAQAGQMAKAEPASQVAESEPAQANTVTGAAPETKATENQTKAEEPSKTENPTKAEEPNKAEESVKPEMSSEYTEEELTLDPLVLQFLDADSYEQRLNILAGLQHRVTDEMITTMAIACDVEVSEGSTEERFDSLRNCLLTLERYECNRIR